MDKIDEKHIIGFDYLRIILCVGVIALHTNIFDVPSQYVGGSVNPLFYRIIVYNYFWVCVPLFILLSLFLYCKNQ